MDIMTGAIGILSLFIVVLSLHSVTNANIELEIDPPAKNDLYPLFITCSGEKLLPLCDDIYLDSQELKKSLREMCLPLNTVGIQGADRDQTWSILKKFFSSNWFDRRHFYVFALIRPSGIDNYKKLRVLLYENSIRSGYLPVPENWHIKVKKPQNDE